MSEILTTKEVHNLFGKFSHPFTKPMITKHQKDVSIGIAKILWLLLVKGEDTEQEVCKALNKVFNNNHEKNIGIGSLYFFKMKTALTEKEIKSLNDYYNIDENFNALENWLDHVS